MNDDNMKDPTSLANIDENSCNEAATSRPFVLPKVVTFMAACVSDSPAFLDESLDSIVRQKGAGIDFDPTHILVLDGPVGPEIERVVDQYQDSIIVKRFDTNRGLRYVLNDLLDENARSYDYIMRMDSDDVAHETRFSRQVRFMERHPDVDLVGSQARVVAVDGSVIRHNFYPVGHDAIVDHIHKMTAILHPTFCIRAATLVRMGLRWPTAHMTEDAAIIAELIRKGGRVDNLSSVELDWRFNDEFLSRRRDFRRAKAEFTWYRRGRIVAGKSLYSDIWPLLRLLMRLAPPSVTKFLYEHRARLTGMNRNGPTGRKLPYV